MNSSSLFSVLRIDSDEAQWDAAQLPAGTRNISAKPTTDDGTTSHSPRAAADRKAGKKNAKRKAARERKRAEQAHADAEIADTELALIVEAAQLAPSTAVDGGGASAAEEESEIADADAEDSLPPPPSPPRQVELVECFTVQAGTGRMPVIAPAHVWDSFKLLPVHLRRVSTRVVCGHAEAGGARSGAGAGARSRASARAGSSASLQHQHGPGIEYTHEPSQTTFRSQSELLVFLGSDVAAEHREGFVDCHECGLSVINSRLHLHKRIEHPEAYRASAERRQEGQERRFEQQRLQRQARAHPSPARMLRTHILDDPVAQALADNEDMELQRALLADASAAPSLASSASSSAAAASVSG